MQAGELTEQIIIRRASTASDGAGGKTVTWADYITGLWAKIDDISGRERNRTERYSANGVYQVWVRAPADIGVKDRVQWNGREFNIVEALPLPERHAFFKFIMEEIIN